MFIVEAFNYGCPARHSYIVGVYEDLFYAAEVAAIEELRSNYCCEIIYCEVNTPLEEKGITISDEAVDERAQKKVDEFLGYDT